jgi:hypothetical protein
MRGIGETFRRRKVAGGASCCDNLRNDVAGENDPAWKRTPAISPENSTVFATGGAESGARVIDDPELASLVKVWPTLPAAIRAGILAIVRTTFG